MDLHTGRPIWTILEAPESPHAHRPLEQDEECEVVVVGGGVSGALVADRLAEAGVETVVLDCRDFGCGSTAASTNLLLYETDSSLQELAARFGPDAARRVFELGRCAIDSIEQLAGTLGDRCGFSRRDSLYLASDAAHVTALRQEFELRRRMAFDVQWLDPQDLAKAGYSFSAPGAIRSRGAGQVNALRLTRRLLERAAARGCRQYVRTEVVGVDEERNGLIQLRTTAQHRARARAAVFATGYEADRFLGPRRVGHLTSTWAVAGEPVERFDGWPDRALVWETSRPYLFLRTTDDNRVIVGGEDEPYAQAHDDPGKVRAKARTLLDRFTAMFPRIDLQVATAWAGTFGGSADGLPYIGRPPGRPASYFALGYGGNGITFSAVAADILADLLAGRPSPDARLFRFDR
jgi:glycine/D-amino acid oxidase-like deaminating enzyme